MCNYVAYNRFYKRRFYIYSFYSDIGKDHSRRERQSEALPFRSRKFDQ